MNKRLIIICALIIGTVAVGALALLGDRAYTVQFTSRYAPTSIAVYQASNNMHVTTTVSNNSIQLPNGNYYVHPSDNTTRGARISFSVANKDLIVETNFSVTTPSTSTSDTEPNGDVGAAQNAIKQAFANTMNQVHIRRGEFALNNQWYVASLVFKNSTNDSPGDTYKVIVQNNSDTWKVVGRPEIIHTKHSAPNVPAEVLDRAYWLAP